jgi:hypothetical protein
MGALDFAVTLRDWSACRYEAINTARKLPLVLTLRPAEVAVHARPVMSATLVHSLLRAQATNITRRAFTTSHIVRQEATTTAPNLGHVPPPKKPVGAFRGGCVQYNNFRGVDMSLEHTDSDTQYRRVSVRLLACFVLCCVPSTRPV